MKGDFDAAQQGKKFLATWHKNVLNTPNAGNK